MIKRLKIKYYFWKLRRNKIDLQTVALKLLVSTEKVKEKYNRHINPFKQIKIDHFFFICGSMPFSVFDFYCSRNFK